MKFKGIFSYLILLITPLLSLNAFAYKYAAHVNIENNTSQDLLIVLSGTGNNINESKPFVSDDNQNPDTDKLFYVSANSNKSFFIDNYDWTGWLYTTKSTQYSIYRNNFGAAPTFISKGTVSIYTGGTLWHMFAYFDSEKPSVKNKQYTVLTTPNFDNSSAGTAGNSAELKLKISYTN